MIAYALALLFATGASDTPGDSRCVLKGTLSMSSTSGGDLKGKINAVVYVKTLPRKLWPHAPETKTVVQKDRQFDKSVVVLVQHDSVRFVNEDNFEHSVFSNDDVNAFEMPRSKKGVTGSKTFQELGAVRVQCDIHPKMRTDVLVLQNPVWTFATPDGAWQLGPLPPGEYEVVAWEPNGATVASKKLRCEGELAVPLEKLQQEKEPVAIHKDGTRNRGSDVIY